MSEECRECFTEVTEKDWAHDKLCKNCRLETERKCSKCDNQISKRNWKNGLAQCPRCSSKNKLHLTGAEKETLRKEEEINQIKRQGAAAKKKAAVAKKKAENEEKRFERILAAAKKKAEERIAERIDTKKKADDYAANVKKITAENAAKRKAEDEEAAAKRKAEDEEAVAKKKATAAKRKGKRELDKREEEIEKFGGIEKIWEAFRDSWRSDLRIDGSMPPFEEVKKDRVILARAVDFILGPMKTK